MDRVTSKDMPTMHSYSLPGDGALLIDKPSGITSHGVIGKLRKNFPEVRFGHAGTLDPDATGLLLVLAGKATRFQDILLGSDKEYQGEILLGVRSQTDDSSGILSKQKEPLDFWKQFDQDSLVETIRRKFSGPQIQVPPQVSAIHVEGKRSYDLAREGKQVALSGRSIELEFLQLAVISEDRLRYHIRCSKGTYVRALARDIGDFLGCGGVAGRIHRLASGSLRIEDARSLEASLAGEFSFIPLERLVAHLPGIVVSEGERQALENGRQELLKERCANLCGEYAIAWDENGRLVALLRQVSDPAVPKECSSESFWRLAYVVRA